MTPQPHPDSGYKVVVIPARAGAAGLVPRVDGTAMSQRHPSLAFPLPPVDGAFVAIDFETADHGPDSACAVGLVRVEGLRVVHREAVLIRPPRPQILFSFIHGITWDRVAGALPFAEAWPRLVPLLAGAAVVAAHNAPFDRRVLTACCEAAGHPIPDAPFLCTVQLAR